MQSNNLVQNEATQNQPKLTIKLKKQFHHLMFSKMYVVLTGSDSVLAFHMITREKFTVKITPQEFIIIDLSPYVFACIIGQFIYFYSELALIHPDEIEKVKISKMNVKCLCKYGKGYLLGGYNRNFLPQGGFIKKRTIYYLQNFSQQHKNKPLWEIPMPKSQSPISVLDYQHPYLLCYIDPIAYILNPEQKQILVSFQKNNITRLGFIEGRYAYNEINLIGLYQQNQKSNIITTDVQRLPIFGIEVNQTDQQALDYCISKDGRVFVCCDYHLYEYHPGKRKKYLFKEWSQNNRVISVECTHKNSLIVLVGMSCQKEVEKSQKINSQPIQTNSQSFFQIFYLN